MVLIGTNCYLSGISLPITEQLPKILTNHREQLMQFYPIIKQNVKVRRSFLFGAIFNYSELPAKRFVFYRPSRLKWSCSSHTKDLEERGEDNFTIFRSETSVNAAFSKHPLFKSSRIFWLFHA